MPRPTTACLRLPEGLDVTWDRGVAHDDGSLFIYGWIEREYASALNGRAHEILVLQFDRTGQMVWWITSSAAWSQKLWDYFAEEGEHIDCLPWRVAIYQAGKIAEGLPPAPPPPPPAHEDPGVGIKEGGRLTDVRRTTRLSDNYFHRRPGILRLVRCMLRFIVFEGHDFESLYTKEPEMQLCHGIPMPTGEQAEVCRLCFRVSERRRWRGFPASISYGSSPSAGRRLESRQVEELPCPA